MLRLIEGRYTPTEADKEHLRASDLASPIGNAYFIDVTKGTDKLPAKPSEIANFQEQVRVIARLSVLTGDHRLPVEIVQSVDRRHPHAEPLGGS